MEMSRIKQLAGMKYSATEGEVTLLRQLNEVVEIPDDISFEELIKRLDACKRALSIVSKLPDPVDKKKWLSATFVNLNKVRGAMQRMMKQMGFDPETEPTPEIQPPRPASPPAAAPRPQYPPNGDGKFIIGDTRI